MTERVHVVQDAETIEHIALQYGVNLSQLKRLNKLDSINTHVLGTGDSILISPRGDCDSSFVDIDSDDAFDEQLNEFNYKLEGASEQGREHSDRGSNWSDDEVTVDLSNSSSSSHSRGNSISSRNSDLLFRRRKGNNSFYNSSPPLWKLVVPGTSSSQGLTTAATEGEAEAEVEMTMADSVVSSLRGDDDGGGIGRHYHQQQQSEVILDQFSESLLQSMSPRSQHGTNPNLTRSFTSVSTSSGINGPPPMMISSVAIKSQLLSLNNRLVNSTKREMILNRKLKSITESYNNLKQEVHLLVEKMQEKNAREAEKEKEKEKERGQMVTFPPPPPPPRLLMSGADWFIFIIVQTVTIVGLLLVYIIVHDWHRITS